MKESVYIETSVVSYYSSAMSRDLVVAGHQQITQMWWKERLSRFEAFVSELVLKEAAAGDSTAANGRLAAIDQFGSLELDNAALQLSKRLKS